MAIGSSTIRLAGLTKRFSRQLALDAVDITVPAGSFTAILGPSGSGKSTLLMTIAGFQHPDDGRVLVDGADITALPAEKRGIGVVFQGYALFPHMTVAANIAYPLRARGMDRRTIADKVRAMARMMEIEELMTRLPAEISGGQRQRVAIARALVFEPKLLLLDEPLSALDRNLRDRMKDELRRVHRKLGVTVIMVTHDQDEATELADNIIVMDKGTVIADGNPLDLYRTPPSRKVAAFFGRANLLVVSAPDDTTIGAGGARLARQGIAGTGATLLIRPETLSLATKDANLASMSVTVETVVFRSGRYTVSGRLDTGEPIVAELAASTLQRLAPGRRIQLQFSGGYLLD